MVFSNVNQTMEFSILELSNDFQVTLQCNSDSFPLSIPFPSLSCSIRFSHFPGTFYAGSHLQVFVLAVPSAGMLFPDPCHHSGLG